MRKLHESSLVSLDGVFGQAHLWAMNYFGPEAEHEALKRLNESDALLMGRGTYEIFSKAWPNRTGAFADRINGIKKYVFSSELKAVSWANAEIVSAHALDFVSELKRAPGGNLVIYGHGRLTQALFARGLVDQVRFSIHPVFVGEGKQVFTEGDKRKLQHVETKTYRTGVVSLTYDVQLNS